jgi:hypothetical protein
MTLQTPSDTKPPDKRKRETQHCRPDQMPMWKIILEVAAAIIGVGVLIIYALQLNRMSEANRITKNAMLASQRPWIGLEEKNGVQTDAITINSKGGIDSRCRIRPKNYGNYPAQNVLPFCGLMVIQSSIVPVHKHLLELCREGVPEHGGSVLFPGQTDVWEWGAGVTPEQIVHSPDGKGSYLILLTAVVNYNDQLGTRHCSAFAFKGVYADSLAQTPKLTQPGWGTLDGVVDP